MLSQKYLWQSLQACVQVEGPKLEHMFTQPATPDKWKELLFSSFVPDSSQRKLYNKDSVSELNCSHQRSNLLNGSVVSTPNTQPLQYCYM